MQKNEFIHYLKKYISAPVQSCLGIYTTQQKISVAEIFKENDNFKLTFLEEIRLDDFKDVSSEMVAEKIKLLCLRNNLKTDNVSLCLPISNVWWLEQKMPEMPEDELRHAVKFQIDGRGPYENVKYWYDYIHGENALIISGSITEAEGRELIENFAQNDLRLCGITMLKGMQILEKEENVISFGKDYINLSADLTERDFSEEDFAALYTAYGGISNRNFLNILPVRYRMEEIEWGRLSLYAGVAAILLMVEICGYNWWQIHQSEAELMELQKQKVLITKQVGLMRTLQEKELIINKKEEILSKLTKERISLYALMIHLGTVEYDGIRLTEVKYVGQGKFICSGKAAQYNNVVAYLDEFEERQYYFQMSPKVLEAKKDDEGLINFEMELRVKTE